MKLLQAAERAHRILEFFIDKMILPKGERYITIPSTHLLLTVYVHIGEEALKKRTKDRKAKLEETSSIETIADRSSEREEEKSKEKKDEDKSGEARSSETEGSTPKTEDGSEETTKASVEKESSKEEGSGEES